MSEVPLYVQTGHEPPRQSGHLAPTGHWLTFGAPAADNECSGHTVAEMHENRPASGLPDDRAYGLQVMRLCLLEVHERVLWYHTVAFANQPVYAWYCARIAWHKYILLTAISKYILSTAIVIFG